MKHAFLSSVIASMIWSYSFAAQGEIGVPKDIIASVLTKADCDTTDDQASEDSKTYELGESVKIVVLPCFIGAYQTSSIILQVDSRNLQQARLLELQNWEQINDNSGRWNRTTLFFNVDFDSVNKRLLTHQMGRGMDDCGTAGQYAWKGGEFKLTAYWVKMKCDGKPFTTGGSKWRVKLPPS